MVELEKVKDFAEIKSIPMPVFEDEKPRNWNYWVSKIDGSLICPENTDKEFNILLGMGIVDLQNTNHTAGNSANIGFNKQEQKWYGWSHRAIFGFGIGSTCKKGDCHFIASNKEDDIESILAFWDDKYQEDVSWIEVENEEGIKGIQMTYKYSDKTPNEKLRGTIGEQFEPLMTKYGKGEWTAKTLEDAKQMAIDFARSVS